MKSILVACLATAASISAFNLLTIDNKIQISSNRLFSTDPSTSNSELFSTPNVVGVESSGDVSIDFDALANESANEASKKIAISDM